MKKRGSKGKELIYNEIQTAEYLLPNDELRTIFSIRIRMINIPSNFVSKENNFYKCICNEKEDMKHLYECNYLNRENIEVQFERIYYGTIREQKVIVKRITRNNRNYSKIVNTIDEVI